jgi:hypothetical protein
MSERPTSEFQGDVSDKNAAFGSKERDPEGASAASGINLPTKRDQNLAITPV